MEFSSAIFTQLLDLARSSSENATDKPLRGIKLRPCEYHVLHFGTAVFLLLALHFLALCYNR